jgi:hypothetical protein
VKIKEEHQKNRLGDEGEERLSKDSALLTLEAVTAAGVGWSFWMQALAQTGGVLGYVETVADPRFGLNEFRLGRVKLYFFSELIDHDA